MTDDELRTLIARGEGETLELKAGAPPLSALVRDVVAFANTKGGRIVVGVDERTGRARGVDARTLDRLADSLERLRELTHPYADVALDQVRLDDQRLAVLTVPLSPDRPVAERRGGAIYVRRGATSMPGDPRDVRQIVLDAALTTFEDTAVPQATADDLDPTRVAAYLAARAPLAGHTPDQRRAALANLGFLAPARSERSDVVPTVAALLLFGRHPQRFFPHATIAVRRVLDEPPDHAVVPTIVDGTLPDQVAAAADLLAQRMRTGFRVDGFTRTDLPEYPPAVVRELIVNAVAHRDYSMTGASIEIRLFPARWEIQSPGRLPGALIPATLVEGPPTRRARNPRLTEAMRVLGLGEASGFGLLRVRTRLASEGYPPIAIAETGDAVTVTLRAGRPRRADTSARARRLDALADEPARPRWERVLEYLLAHDGVSNAQYRELVDVSAATAARDLGELVHHGLLERRGTTRDAYYTLPDQPAPPDAADGQ